MTLVSMKYVYLFIALLCLQMAGFGQTVTFPINFEGGSLVNTDFSNFDGGTGTVIANPVPGGSNTAATVGQMVSKLLSKLSHSIVFN